eukprot:scaffold5732_cov116-Isochrysis_galbana.AAC.6
MNEPILLASWGTCGCGWDIRVFSLIDDMCHAHESTHDTRLPPCHNPAARAQRALLAPRAPCPVLGDACASPRACSADGLLHTPPAAALLPRVRGASSQIGSQTVFLPAEVSFFQKSCVSAITLSV